MSDLLISKLEENHENLELKVFYKRLALLIEYIDFALIGLDENHNIINGLGSAVAEALSENYPVPLERVGIKDLFGEVGSVDFLKKRFELTAEEIANRAQKAISRK
jgi:deoxyxylulose-5-phosphate synthase